MRKTTTGISTDGRGVGCLDYFFKCFNFKLPYKLLLFHFPFARLPTFGKLAVGLLVVAYSSNVADSLPFCV